MSDTEQSSSVQEFHTAPWLGRWSVIATVFPVWRKEDDSPSQVMKIIFVPMRPLRQSSIAQQSEPQR